MNCNLHRKSEAAGEVEFIYGAFKTTVPKCSTNTHNQIDLIIKLLH